MRLKLYIFVTVTLKVAKTKIINYFNITVISKY